MTKTMTFVLSILLALSVVSAGFFYIKNSDSKSLILENEGKIAELNKRNVQMEKEKATLQDQINVASQKLKEIRGTLPGLKNTIQVKEQEISNQKAKLKDIQHTLEKKQQDEVNLEAELAKFETEIRKLKEQYSATLKYKDTTVLDLNERQSELEKAISQFKKELKDTRTENTDLKSKVAADQSEIESLRNNYSELSSRNEAVEIQMNVIKSSSEEMISQLKKELKGIQSEKSILKDQFAADQQKIETLKNKYSDLQKQNAAALIQMNTLKSTSEATITQLKKELATRTLSLSNHEKESAALRAENTKLESRLESVQNKVETLKNETSHKNSLLADLHEQINKANELNSEFQEKLRHYNQKIDQLDKRLSEAMGDKVIADSKINELKTTYQSLVTDLKKQIQNQEVTIKTFEKKISVTFIDRILFNLGKASITPEGKHHLKKVGEILKNIQGQRIRVIGHTDNIPIIPKYQYKFPSNWELSTARAAAVVRFFQNEIGIEPQSLEAVGHSFYEPISDNESEEGRAQNRRVNIIIAPMIE